MYFSSFPTITYRNVQVRDITRSVSIPNSIRRIPTAFYPHELTEGQREDLLSKLVYDTEDFDWLIWLTNQIVDPYYGWHLTSEQFQQWMIEKYGSVETAQQKILYWRNDWSLDEFDISPANYNNNLSENQKKYWEPVYGAGLRINSYRRRQEDWTLATNEVRRLNVGNTSGFSVGSLLDVFGDTDIERVGSGEVVSITNSTSMIIKNPLGTFDTGSRVGNTTITDWETLHSTSDEERSYYSPVYAWDHYYEQNEKNKLVLLLDPSYTGQAYIELKKDLNK